MRRISLLLICLILACFLTSTALAAPASSVHENKPSVAEVLASTPNKIDLNRIPTGDGFTGIGFVQVLNKSGDVVFLGHGYGDTDRIKIHSRINKEMRDYYGDRFADMLN